MRGGGAGARVVSQCLRRRDGGENADGNEMDENVATAVGMGTLPVTVQRKAKSKGKAKDGRKAVRKVQTYSGVKVEVNDVVLRFDFRNEPVETTNLSYEFVRDIGKIYNDGTIKLSQTVD